jgi:sugar lactone lactonase YvrE
MRFPRIPFSPALIFSGFCGALLLAGCGKGGTPPTSLSTPTLIFAAIATQSFGNAPVLVSATSASAGAVTYSVTSGPAAISGNVVTLTGVGPVTLSASQAATATYAAASTSTSFMVTQGTTTLNFTAIATQLATNAPFPVSATSASTGTVTYSVTSGPASITGSTLTLTGAPGTVILNASQVATTNYAAATANTSFTVVTTGATTGTSFTGKVQATGLPVIGASVQLYEAGTSATGSSNAALATALTTDVNGNFTVPSTFSCVSANTVLFLLAKGGKVGSGGTANSALWLAAALPPCGSLTNSLSVTVNELTTVAMTEALAQFTAAGGNVRASATNTLGLANAVVNAQMLANLTTGVSPGASVPANVAVNSAKLNSLANAFAGCAVSSAACTPLFAAATVGSTVPTNTLDAAFNIARNPGANVAALYALSVGTTFTPVLTGAPPDWIMFLEITGGGLNEPTALSVDGSGNLWSADFNQALSKFAPNGSTSFSNGITGPELTQSFGLAIDPSNNIWVESDETPGSPNNSGSVAKFNNAGVALSSGIGFTAGVYFPTGIAADPNGDMWIANYGNSTYALYNSSGAAITANCNVNGCGAGVVEFPVAVAVDGNHFGWIGNQAANFVTRISLDGTSLTTITCGEGPSGVAVDGQNNIWVANYFTSSIAEISNTGNLISGNYTGGGINHPQGIAVDGGGSVWIANYRGSSITELAGASAATPGAAISPAIGYGSDSNLFESFGLAIDASGNIWISSFASNTIVEFLGVAAPVKTPVVGPVQIP